MPVVWQSSQRPMYVRTVWVDGFRHAILTHDDPYFTKQAKRRPHSSASAKNSRLSHHTDEFQHCLRKLNLVVNTGKSIIAKRPKSSHEVEQLQLADIEQEEEEEAPLKVSPQPLNETGRHNLFEDMKTMRNNKTTRPEEKENTELSDRVLQWLDLAGKVDLLAPDNAQRMSQPRHSWPELQRRHNLLKSKTTIDIRQPREGGKPSPKTGDSPKAQQNCIDRGEFYVPTSANTIENYARQSRNVRITPRCDSQAKAKDSAARKTKDFKTNMVETRQKVASERTAVEKQYAEMMSKKLIPDVSKTAKKQVHIFMPDLPKKPNLIASSNTSRAESLLSHLSQKSLRQ